MVLSPAGNPNLCTTTAAAGFFSSASHYSEHTPFGASIPPAFLLHSAPPNGRYLARARGMNGQISHHLGAFGQQIRLNARLRAQMKALCCRVRNESNSEGGFSGSSWCYRCLGPSPNKRPRPSGKIPLETCQSQHVCRRGRRLPSLLS